MSRLPGKRARPVLRGPRRGDASGLPDWKPVFYLLEAHGLDPWLVNARDVKHLPGRPKTDVLMRCGCARSPNARCYDPASCRQLRFAGCGI